MSDYASKVLGAALLQGETRSLEVASSPPRLGRLLLTMVNQAG